LRLKLAILAPFWRQVGHLSAILAPTWPILAPRWAPRGSQKGLLLVAFWEYRARPAEKFQKPSKMYPKGSQNGSQNNKKRCQNESNEVTKL